jgi:hypothetical protein
LLSFNVKSTGPGLHLSVSINKVQRYFLEVPQNDLLICLHLPEHDSTQHVITLEMTGKLPQHTVVDPRGHILSDRWLEFSNFRFQDIDLGHQFAESAVYLHDHNGHSDVVAVPFSGSMYFNGRVEWQYDQDPLLWLLELT